jgi:hypothetical protein
MPFKIKKIWREIEADWDSPTMAFVVNYEFVNGILVGSEPRNISAVCDVRILF